MKGNRGYYITHGLSSEENRSGIGMKIRNQIKVFNREGLDFGEITNSFITSKFSGVCNRIPFTKTDVDWVYYDEYGSADYLYMRRPYIMTGNMRSVLCEIRRKNPKVKIVIEIPTYPYDEEFKDRKLSGMIIKRDQYNRNRMKGIVDRFAVVDDIDLLFGVPTIKISNGIDVDLINKRIPQNDTDIIHICAVAMFCFWHGYERLIEGLAQYYANGGTRNIICHFVGEGAELTLYKAMVKDKHLDNHFVWHGYAEGKALDEIYNLCTLSLGSFGMYKINNDISSNLKSRESVARGIPSITGCQTDIFIKEEFPYFLEFPNDPSPVQISKIIDFHDEIYQNGQEPVIEHIREFAYQTISMDSAMKTVIDYFKS